MMMMMMMSLQHSLQLEIASAMSWAGDMQHPSERWSESSIFRSWSCKFVLTKDAEFELQSLPHPRSNIREKERSEGGGSDGWRIRVLWSFEVNKQSLSLSSTQEDLLRLSGSQMSMAKSGGRTQHDNLEIESMGTLYKGEWEKKYWSSSRVLL